MSTTETKAVGASRPLSPHLQIYKPTWTMAMSIVHRITGAALYFGTILLALWLLSAASGKGAYDSAQWYFGSAIGRFVLFGYTWALVHHLIGGLRHFVWDVGAGYDPVMRQTLAKGNLIASVVLTAVIWIVGYALR